MPCLDTRPARREPLAACLRPAALVLAALAAIPASALAAGPASAVRAVDGVTSAGEATELWLALLRRRLVPAEYAAIAPLRKPFTDAERAWAALIRSRLAAWEREVPPLAELFRPADAPSAILLVLGNRGGDDAFTHDPTTVGFDLSALHSLYGDARLAENTERIDRFFRHECMHLLQKAWLAQNPWPEGSPLGLALAEIWAEGLGHYQSLSARWRSQAGQPSVAAARALAELEPRLVARLSALACAAPEAGAALTADLSRGAFDHKWGALTAALWLEAEQQASGDALRRFVLAGPAGVWELAARRLPESLRAALDEARAVHALCSPGKPVTGIELESLPSRDRVRRRNDP